jgi:hypothetical protein
MKNEQFLHYLYDRCLYVKHLHVKNQVQCNMMSKRWNTGVREASQGHPLLGNGLLNLISTAKNMYTAACWGSVF